MLAEKEKEIEGQLKKYRALEGVCGGGSDKERRNKERDGNRENVYDREKQKDKDGETNTHTHTHIERERETDRQTDRELMCTFKKDIERDRKRRMTDRELMCTFNKEIERERERWKEIMIKTERQIDIETGKISEMERY